MKEYASSYAVFRKLVIALELFKNPNFLKQIPDSEEERQEEFFDAEEIRTYQKYMDNLPTSIY